MTMLPPGVSALHPMSSTICLHNLHFLYQSLPSHESASVGSLSHGCQVCGAETRYARKPAESRERPASAPDSGPAGALESRHGAKSNRSGPRSENGLAVRGAQAARRHPIHPAAGRPDPTKPVDRSETGHASLSSP